MDLKGAGTEHQSGSFRGTNAYYLLQYLMGTGVGLGNANNANVLNAQMINYDNYLELEYYMYSENGWKTSNQINPKCLIKNKN